jgi:hypothetical protein
VFLEANNDFLLFLSCALEIHILSFYGRHDKREIVVIFTPFCFNFDVDSIGRNVWFTIDSLYAICAPNILIIAMQHVIHNL